MLILQASADGLVVEVDRKDGRFWLICRDLGINPEDVVTIFVTFQRGTLTDEKCYDNFDREHRGGDPDCDSDPELPF